MNHDSELREQLVNLLTVRQAHADFEDAVANLPAEHINTRPAGVPYTFWQLLEHLRLAQQDILDYIEAERYHWPTFPDSYWPDDAAETDLAGWQRSVERFRADRARLIELVRDPAVDLFAPLPHSGERRHTLLREILIAASHNAYHTGALILMRQSLELWR
jgi:uncharacterized damage-inducible protein DinB